MAGAAGGMLFRRRLLVFPLDTQSNAKNIYIYRYIWWFSCQVVPGEYMVLLFLGPEKPGSFGTQAVKCSRDGEKGRGAGGHSFAFGLGFLSFGNVFVLTTL